jgi:hypothetical protein
VSYFPTFPATPEMFVIAARIAAHLFSAYPGERDGNELLSVVAGDTPDITNERFTDALTLSHILGWTEESEDGGRWSASGPLRWYVEIAPDFDAFDKECEDPADWL